MLPSSRGGLEENEARRSRTKEPAGAGESDSRRNRVECDPFFFLSRSRQRGTKCRDRMGVSKAAKCASERDRPFSTPGGLATAACPSKQLEPRHAPPASPFVFPA